MKRAAAAVAIVFGALLVLGVTLNSSRTSAPAPVAVQSSEEIHDGHVRAALYACEQWTKTNARLGLGEIVDSYEVDARVPAHHYRVRIDWRAQGSGLLMYSRCEYSEAGGVLTLVKGESGRK